MTTSVNWVHVCLSALNESLGLRRSAVIQLISIRFDSSEVPRLSTTNLINLAKADCQTRSLLGP